MVSQRQPRWSSLLMPFCSSQPIWKIRRLAIVVSGRTARALFYCSSLVLPILPIGSAAQEPVNVLTFHNDNSRTCANLKETALTTSNVNAKSFGKLYSVPLDGNSFGQPLYVSSVHIGAADHAMVYVATSNDSVYGLDAHSGTVVWHVGLGKPVPRLDVSAFSPDHMPSYVPPYYDLYPFIGIASTPVIDPASQSLFVVVKTKQPTDKEPIYKYSLHVLDLRDGSEKNA